MDADLERQVRARARNRCEYCGFPESFSELRFVLDHVIARQHGGPTTLENLALSCVFCNAHKGPNLAGIDPVTGAMTPLFNPRRDLWADHFLWHGARIVGRTAVGRSTIQVLAMNDPLQLSMRRALIAEGVLPGT